MSSTAAGLIRTGLFIDGEERFTAERTAIADPALPSQTVGEAAVATRRDVADSVQAAARAYPAWSALTPAARAALLEHAVRRSESEWREDARILCRENGKILAECLRDTSMLQRRTAQTVLLAEEVARTRELAPTPEMPIATTVEYQPLGVVTIIVPFNWPVGILSSALPHALLAGNTVVVKPPRTAPLATTRIATRMARLLPPGVLNVVTGHDDDMAGLVANQDVAKVCFTGSVGGGRRIMSMAATSLTRVTLELGGNDPALILDDAELDDAHLDRLFGAVFSTTGQVCMNAKRLFVHRSRFDEVVDGLSRRLERTVLGHGLDPDTTMGPLHSPGQRAFVEGLIAEAERAGAAVLRFGDLPLDPALRAGSFVQPALVLAPDPALRIVQEEQFGPVAPLLAFDDDEEAIRLANDSWAGLGASVWSADRERALTIARRLVCGYVWINDHGAPRLDLRAPFGGMKQSGMGREQGIDGIRAFQDTRAVSVSTDHPVASATESQADEERGSLAWVE